MKIRRRLPEYDENLHQELVNSGWITLREPGSLAVAIILSVPFMVVNFFISIMSFSFAPFEASYHLSRVFYAIALGLFYGACFEKAGSMYYPMIMHSFTNVMMMGVSIILSIIL